ncbi:MAG: protein kinase [Tannerellaceae bacterium]|jgi:serine/threonine-protein kinase|nr:protein kinase [Tannerellaceae bacterium]
MKLPNGYHLQHGKYRLSHAVGQGGFGITYRAVWLTEVKGSLGMVKTEIPICIKEYFFKDYCYRDTGDYTVNIHSESGRIVFDQFKEKLLKEAKILSDVHHPHIVNVLEVFEENNTAYIVMEFISGHSLKSLLEKEGVLPEAKLLRYIRQIGEALQFVHEKNILHLDIKPSNILIDHNDNARLIDFGVSKRYDMEDNETSTTMMTLSKGFASIEQYDNEGTQTFSPCPDIYSLGSTMYHLLTGVIPTESILRATRPLQKPSDINPAITPKTEAAIMKAMQLKASDRFRNMKEMLDALDSPPVEAQQREEAAPTLPLPPERGGGGDTTLLTSPTIPDQGEKGKKRRKRVVFIVLSCTFVFIGSSITLLNVMRPAGQLPMPQAAGEVETATERDTAEVTLIPPGEAAPQLSAAEMMRDTAAHTGRQEAEEPDERQQAAEEDTPAPLPPEALTGEELEEAYTSFVASGRSQMEAANFEEAKRLFMRAQELKQTTKIAELINESEAKADEKRMTERKALYEEKWPFGQYMIVRKKSNGRYGVIDAKGEEIIPCKYINVDNANEGRAFERDDKLFDIYDENGGLVRSDVMY